MAYREVDLHQQCADYLRRRYPGVLWHTDFGSGIKLTMGQAIKQKRLQGGQRAWPDMFIAEPTCLIIVDRDGEVDQRGFYGLFIELKREGTRLKNGSIPSTPHHKEQEAVLQQLRKRGYRAEFCCGFDEFKALVDEYLK